MQFLTLPKLAAQSGWSICRIRRLVANQELPHIRVNGRLMLPANAIDDYVATHFVDAVGRPEPRPPLVLVGTMPSAARTL
jgi:hypothetical protein